MKFSDFMVSDIDYRKDYEALIASISGDDDPAWKGCIDYCMANYMFFDACRRLYKSKAKDKPLHYKAVKDAVYSSISDHMYVHISTDFYRYSNENWSYLTAYSVNGYRDSYFIRKSDESNTADWDRLLEKVSVDIIEPSAIYPVYERQIDENEAFRDAIESLIKSYESRRAGDIDIGVEKIRYRYM